MVYAVSALSRGVSMVLEPGLRRYVFVPLLVNLVIYAALFALVIERFSGWVDYWMAAIPGWLGWLEWLIWPLVIVSLLLVLAFTFTRLATLIAAPFYGFLAEKVEQRLSGQSESIDERSLWRQGIDSLRRELQKIAWMLPRVLLLVLIGFVPGLNILAPPGWALFSIWSMSIQYLDYPMDNNGVSFAEMRRRLTLRWWSTLTFGGVVSALIWIPVVNLLVMPAAVAAGVIVWRRDYRALPAPHRH
ncbi:sulfate transporter CysZ [Kushneria aurantia]|uniref:Sulfate transporter CysZ n=1 Tax=Kushneria aurantia TaxID=504092 RepID=A0ABV6G0M2_9GAMM|nr:sulfate transporter CysZ [Kushneria aurantia]